MTTNLINILQKSFTEKNYFDIAQHVNINTESTKNGIKALIPVVLASILSNNTLSTSALPTWWNILDDDYPYSDDNFIDSKVINNSSFLVKGREVLSGMFRTNHDELVTSVSSVAGIQKAKAAGLIEVSVPLIVGYLKNWVLKKGWKFKDLIANLIESKTVIKEALPQGVSPKHFEVEHKPENISIKKKPKRNITENDPKSNFSETIKVEVPTTEKPKKRKNNGLIWFGGLLVLAIILWYLMGNSSCTRNTITGDLIILDMSEITTLPQYYEKPMDGTYYAYKMMPKLVLRLK